MQSKRVWARVLGVERGVVIEADAPRVSCPEHGVTVAAVPWARPPVTPEDPIIVPTTGSTDPIVELPATPGVMYAVRSASGELGPIVTATVRDGFTWAPLPERWKSDDSTSATFVPSPVASVDPPASQELAYTGAVSLLVQSVLAIVLVLVGWAMYRVGRRRRAT